MSYSLLQLMLTVLANTQYWYMCLFKVEIFYLLSLLKSIQVLLRSVLIKTKNNVEVIIRKPELSNLPEIFYLYPLISRLQTFHGHSHTCICLVYSLRIDTLRVLLACYLATHVHEFERFKIFK